MLSVFMTTVPDRADGPKFTKFIAGKQGIPIFFYLFYSYFNSVFSGILISSWKLKSGELIELTVNE